MLGAMKLTNGGSSTTGTSWYATQYTPSDGDLQVFLTQNSVTSSLIRGSNLIANISSIGTRVSAAQGTNISIYTSTIDSGGNTYVIGSSNVYAHISKFDTNMSLLWQTNYIDNTGNASPTATSQFTGIVINSAGNPVVAGRTYQSGSARGSIVTFNRLNGTVNSQYLIANLTSYIDGTINSDTSGNIYFHQAGGDYDWVSKINTSGTLQWQRQNGNVMTLFGASNSGNVYSGWSENPGRFVVNKHNSDGTLQWSNKYWNNNYGTILLSTYTQDPVTNNEYITGYGNVGPTSLTYQPFILSIAANGSILQQQTISATFGGTSISCPIYGATVNNNKLQASFIPGLGGTANNMVLSTDVNSGTGTFSPNQNLSFTYANTSAFTSNSTTISFGTVGLTSSAGANGARPGVVTYSTNLGNFNQLTYTTTDGPSTSIVSSYLVVAGGGSGGSRIGGGAGAGGLLSGSVVLNSGTTYTITVGGGASSVTSTPGVQGNNGTDSSISGSGLTTITATGGGGGGAYIGTSGTTGKNGGSGGGGSYSGNGGVNTAGTGTSGQGNNGGAGSATIIAGGGGGGATAAGATPPSAGRGGNGGDGLQNAISGTATYYAGGGGGSSSTTTTVGAGGSGGGGAGSNSNNNATAGTANTGGGGGGARNDSDTTNVISGAGGSGVVILSVPTSLYTGTYTGTVTVTTSGSNTILTFTGSGTYVA